MHTSVKRLNLGRIFSKILLLSVFLYSILSFGQVITNTAHISYIDSDSQLQNVFSNTVSSELAPNPTPAQINFRHFSGYSGSAMVRADGAQCFQSGSFQSVPTLTKHTGQAIDLVNPIQLSNASAYHVGEAIFLEVNDQNRNMNPAQRESIEIEILSSNGDHEKLRLQETHLNTGVFVGGIQTVSNSVPLNAFDCQLTLEINSEVLTQYTDVFYPTDQASAQILVDPYGTVYNSGTGVEIDGVLVHIVNAIDNSPAQVFDDDGVTPYPSTIVSGSTFTVGSVTHVMPPGGYRFPLMPPGTYKLIVENLPAGYSFPTVVPPHILSSLRDSTGAQYSLTSGYLGQAFVISDGPALNIDLAVDPPTTGLVVKKTSNKSVLSLGDFNYYTVSVSNVDLATALDVELVDILPVGFRLKKESIRVNGERYFDFKFDDRKISLNLPNLGGGQSHEIKYLIEVTGGTPLGNARNVAIAHRSNGDSSNEGISDVEIQNPFFSSHATILGRVSEGSCDNSDPSQKGIENVKILMEDGSYAVSDKEGRFHFKGVNPGTHVLRIVENTLPDGYVLKKCFSNNRNYKTAHSRFLDLRGASLWNVYFYAEQKKNSKQKSFLKKKKENLKKENSLKKDNVFNGIGIDWLKNAKKGTRWLYPQDKHNSRMPNTRVAVKHLKDDDVFVHVNGVPVKELYFEQTHKNRSDGVYVSEWGGVELKEGANKIQVQVFNSQKTKTFDETRIINFSNKASKLIFLPHKSRLVANGMDAPQLKFKVLDESGLPVRKGVKIVYRVNRPYMPLQNTDDVIKGTELSSESSTTEFNVVDDEGHALLELNPTDRAGELRLKIFVDKDKTQDLKIWLEPDVREWVLVGLAEGTLSYNKINDNMISLKEEEDKDKLIWEGNTRLYAKGKISEKWIATLAYDSSKDLTDKKENFGRQLDANRFYTLYADRSDHKKDNVSSEKLYLKIEKSRFYHLFGDFDTEMNGTKLNSYNRSFTGVKSVLEGKNMAYKAFISRDDSHYVKYEIQANDLTQQYLRYRDIIINSEKIHVEVRDSENSLTIKDRKTLTRNLDYNIDYFSGLVEFKDAQDVKSRDFEGNPRFLIFEFETHKKVNKKYHYGARVTAKLLDDKLKFSATHIHEETDLEDSDKWGLDMQYQITPSQNFVFEWSQTTKDKGSDVLYGSAHYSEYNFSNKNIEFDLYSSFRQKNFGLLNDQISEQGTQKYGANLKLHLSKNISWVNEYEQQNMDTGSERRLMKTQIQHQSKVLDSSIAFRDIREKTGSEDLKSQQVIAAIRKGFLKNKYSLELRGEQNIAPESEQSVDYPSRYVAQLSYKLSKITSLILSQEHYTGKLNSNVTKLGFKSKPWSGSEVMSDISQEINEAGMRTYSTVGLKQSFQYSSRLSYDFGFNIVQSLQKNKKTVPFNPSHPSRVGTYLGNNTFFEDYFSIHSGVAFKGESFNWNMRAEGRFADLENRWALQSNITKNLSKFTTLTSTHNLARSRFKSDAKGYSYRGDLSIAHRPLNRRWTLLNKVKLRHDYVDNLDGLEFFGIDTMKGVENTSSSALINNFNVNFFASRQQRQYSLFHGAKINRDYVEGSYYKSFTDLWGFEFRQNLGLKWDFGLHSYVLNSWSANTSSFALGPSFGWSPVKNSWISLGYNFYGFTDTDFTAAQYARNGVYLKLRLKFDEKLLKRKGKQRVIQNTPVRKSFYSVKSDYENNNIIDEFNPTDVFVDSLSHDISSKEGTIINKEVNSFIDEFNPSE